MPEPTGITKLWLLAQETEDGKLQVTLAGPDYAKHPHFGIVIANIIGHVADHFNMDPQDILDWVRQEIDSPTSTRKRVGPN